MTKVSLELDEQLEKLEAEQLDMDDNNEIPPDDIVAFNELRSCADLLRMYKEGQLEIQPAFQREIIWSPIMQTRLIDSLVKQLPIPSLCISLDYKTQERFVIDGLQRIASIVKFLDVATTKEWKLAKLDDIDERISGKTNLTIKSKYSDLFNKVENTVIPITVLRCNYSKKSHMEYLFTIFHRLNTGGAKLTNQEIRNCIYSGAFNDFLKQAVEYESYLKLFEIETDKKDRFANEELVLRFISFTYNHDKYKGQLSKFLNDFMDTYRKASSEKIEEFKKLFERTINLIYMKLLNSQPLPKLSKATTEALFVGVAINIEVLEQETNTQLQERFALLRQDELFAINNLKNALSDRNKVLRRIKKSIQIFG